MQSSTTLSSSDGAATTTSATTTTTWEHPSSVEEAGALLGATITKCSGSGSSGGGGVGLSSHPGMAAPTTPPPRGMHSAFGVVTPVPSAELVMRLYALRVWLQRSLRQPPGADQPQPLVAAPSILAVLMKLLGVSTKLATHPPVPSSFSTATSSTVTSHATATITASSSSRSPSPLPPLTLSSSAEPVVMVPFDTPPMLSTPLRKLWVDCVTLCHVLGMGLTGPTKITTTSFVRTMMDIAVLNPRSQKASGGVRIAALDVMAALFQVGCRLEQNDVDDTNGAGSSASSSSSSSSSSLSLVSQLAPWSLDVLQVCLKALRSAGNGEPTYRLSALSAAQATARASRQAYANTHPNHHASHSSNRNTAGASSSVLLLMPGAYEEKAVVEALKIVKQAATDKFPEVRTAAAHFAAQLAPLVIHHAPSLTGSGGGGGASSLATPEIHLDDLLQFCFKQLDDESPFCADAWAQALAGALSTAMAYHEQVRAAAASSSSGSGSHPGDDATPGPGASPSDPSPSSRFGGGSGSGGGVRYKPGFSAQHASNLPTCLLYLMDQFVKCGGELVASRMGGTASTGGRSVRVGLSLVLCYLLRQQAGLGRIGLDGAKVTLPQALEMILGRMLGPEMERQVGPPSSSVMTRGGEMTTGGGSGGASGSAVGVGGGGGGGGGVFSNIAAAAVRNRSKGDISLVRLAVCRVLRQGLSEGVVTEPLQLKILHNLIAMVLAQEKIRSDPTQPAQAMPLNANQLQVVLVEMSHLYATLGEAAASTIPDFIPSIGFCLAHRDHGVRHEAAIACEAFTCSFPSQGRLLLQNALDDIQQHHAEMVTLASMKEVTTSSQASVSGFAPVEQATSGLRSMFMRGAGTAPVSREPQPQVEQALPQQYAIHGKALMVSLLVRDLPRLPGGMPTKLMGQMVTVAEVLASSQFHDNLTAANAGGVCMCVRAGFAIFSGVLATGSEGAATHMPLIFGAWQKCCQAAMTGSTKHFHARHDLFCLDGALASVGVFLKYCSELLLSIPEALTLVSALLEDTLKLLMPTGRLGSIPLTPPILARLESAIASLFECFAWLPSGSFPMAADDVFNLAAQHIRSSIETEIPCSILQSLVNREDALLDSKSWSRATREGQLGGAGNIEATIVALTAETVLHGEREAVIHLLNGEDHPDLIQDDSRTHMESSILGAFACDFKDHKVPTPLHEVGGCWRRPSEPSCSSKVRLADAAIQAFSASFGLKSGKEQQAAMNMLETLVPPFLSQLARTIGINTVLIEQDRRSKVNFYSTVLLPTCELNEPHP